LRENGFKRELYKIKGQRKNGVSLLISNQGKIPVSFLQFRSSAMPFAFKAEK
jgi:hypothetical protein